MLQNPPLSPGSALSAPFAVHQLDVGDGHRLHVEEHGHPQGRPVLLLHGGPGSGCSPVLRQAFDLTQWRLICPDQRGAGRSQPAGTTQANTTRHLLGDLRRLRRALGIERWCVAGGSWGATLALLHALDEPGPVEALLLRAVFLARDEDVAGFFSGADELAAACGARPGEPLAQALNRCFMPGDAPDDALADLPRQQAAAQAWWTWERRQCGLPVAPGNAPQDLPAVLQRYRVQAHYLAAGCGLRERGLLKRVRDWPSVPVTLLHGTADRVCPPAGAQALQAVLPCMVLRWVDGAGHDPTHPAMAAAMRSAAAQLLAGSAPGTSP